MDNNNLFSIGEMAKAVGITRKTILNYETKGLITPDKKDGITGNRYYTIDTFIIKDIWPKITSVTCCYDWDNDKEEKYLMTKQLASLAGLGMSDEKTRWISD